MKIVISAHMDLARPVMSINLNQENLSGLVDNFAGVFASYQVSRKIGVSVFFTNYEELDYDGADAVAKSLDKDTCVIVVDTIIEKDVQGKLFSLTNAYGFSDTVWENLKHTFEDKIKFIDSPFEETEDETWIYGHKYGLKSFYFGIPIPGDYYHSTENKVSLEVIDVASQMLEEIIHWLQNNTHE